MKKNYKDIISISLIIFAAALLIASEFINIAFTGDELTDGILKDIILRLIVGVVFCVLIVFTDNKSYLLPNIKLLPRQLLWCIPCFFVVLANFPFTALIGGTAQVIRTDLIALFVLKCFTVGLMEETLFRGLVQPMVYDSFKNKPYGKLITVAITSAIFGLFHLLNLFSGAGIGATFMQVGYSFLIGAMLSAVLMKTGNLWICVVMHAAFNVGGNMITEIGQGPFQDMYFWIFTAVFGVICFAYILNYLIKQK